MRLILSALLLFLATTLFGQEMNNAKLDSLFHTYTDSVVGGAGQWEIYLAETIMFCITDERHDRMRIITPVKPLDSATPAEIMDCMEANFHTALDVKYAIADDVLWVAFIHPLSPLQEDQVIDALAQVRSAYLTYGTLYTSTDLVFPKSEKEAETSETKPKTKRL
ncbi:MAG: hypothetical protein AAFQ37_01045 [Bacteroidota bacterium]